tara:strand:- start:2500 stop:3024 length:525 start_codon:yes stop_codon:yes gene_type:complete
VKPKIINNVLTKENLFQLYDSLIADNMWNLTRSSQGTVAGSFPGCTFINNGEPVYNNPYWIGYFTCLFDTLNQKLTEQHNFQLYKKIKRIALNATNNNYYTEFHADEKLMYSIVGFLTPQWSEEWGGELNIEGEVNKYKPGDFVLFNSEQLHKSQEINKQLPYWRVSINYVIEK